MDGADQSDAVLAMYGQRHGRLECSRTGATRSQSGLGGVRATVGEQRVRAGETATTDDALVRAITAVDAHVLA